VAGLAIVAVIVIATVLVVALVRRDPPGGPRVVVIGDSVTYQSAPFITELFDFTKNIDVQGRPGFTTEELVPVAKERIDGDDPPAIGVFMMGYNDVTRGKDSARGLEAMAEEADQPRCSVWLLLPTKGDYEAAAMTAYNEQVEDRTADLSDVHLETGWRDLADKPSGAAPDPVLVSPDGVHPTEGGRRIIARIMADSVERNCR